MTPLILALATHTPPYGYPQEVIANKMIEILSLTDEPANHLRKMYANSAIGYRYSVTDDLMNEKPERPFWGKDYPKNLPGMRQRNDFYKNSAPQLAHAVCSKAIQSWGRESTDITHVISVSCTGVLAPGLEFRLIESLALNRSVQRLGINFMGCFGAFKGLQVAAAFARENPTHRILLVCTELCSLHLQASHDLHSMLANSLFSDGMASVVVGSQAQEHETPLFSIQQQKSFALDDSLDKMTWEAGDQGFFMHLSPYVPALIKRHIHTFILPLLEGFTEISACDWAIHPGGKSILQAVERGLKLDQAQTKAAWETLWNYGNMSSATFLFVLERLCTQRTDKLWTAGLGFGPGLSMEGILLRKMQNHA